MSIPRILGCAGALALATSLVAGDCNQNGVPDPVDQAGITPIGYWRVESVGATIVDSGPNALDGTSTSAIANDDVPRPTVPQSAIPNLGSSVLGGDGYLTIPNTGGLLAFGGSSFTIEAWVQLDQLSNTDGPNQRQFLVQKKPLNGGGATVDYSVLVQGGNLYTSVDTNYGKGSGYTGKEIVLLFGNGSYSWTVTSFFQIVDNDWHHVSVAYDDQTGDVRFGLDGFFQTIETSGDGHTSGGGPLLIGAHTNSSGTYNQFLRGSVDEVRVAAGVVPPEHLLNAYGTADCNGNGILDVCDIADGVSIDCDGNGQPDECDLANNDCDANGIPDQCDPDCNDNGIADVCDIADGVSLDCQADGVPDECQLDVANIRSYGAGFAEIAVRADVPYMVWLNRFNVGDAAGIVEGIEVLLGIIPNSTPMGVHLWSDPDGDGEPSDAQLLWSTSTTASDDVTLRYFNVPDVEVGATGASFFVGFSMQVTLQDFPAALDIRGEPVSGRSWEIGSEQPIDLNDLSAGAVEYGPIEDLLFGGNWVIRAFMRGPGNDCNANGIPDDCDTADGTSADLDGNNVPDECEDCNGNGVVDGFEILGGTASDCDGDGIPDECQLTSHDCNGNGVPDSCELLGADCNGNGVLDSCDIAAGTEVDLDLSGIPDSCEDCNRNGIPDAREIIRAGDEAESVDCNQDGVPDVCQLGPPLESMTYAYDDGEKESNLNITAALDLAWMNQFTVEPGGEWVSAIEIVWGNTYPGQAAMVVLWADPNNDGHPGDARVIASAHTTTVNIQSNIYNTVPIPPTYVGEAGQSFFVGAFMPDPFNTGPMAVDISDADEASWVAYASVGYLDLNDLDGALGLSFWNFFDFMVRAVAGPGVYREDCNANRFLDECDIAFGGSSDSNLNGLPDDCECVGDLNGDELVGFDDLLALLTAWGSCGGCVEDVNGSGDVGFDDLLIVLTAWGGCD